MARIERERSVSRTVSLNASRTRRHRLSVSADPRYPPMRQKNCSISLPVEIQMSVDIRTSCPRGVSRARGGMVVESPERRVNESLSVDEPKQPLPVLQEILRKQQAILKSLTGQKSVIDELELNDEEQLNEESGKTGQRRDNQKRSEKPEDDSLSDGVKIGSNISIDNDDEENKKRRRRPRRLKGGRNDFQLPTSIEEDVGTFEKGVEGGQMIELFNRQRVKDSKIEGLSHKRRSTSRPRNEESADDETNERKYDRRERDKDSRKFRGSGGSGTKTVIDSPKRN